MRSTGLCKDSGAQAKACRQCENRHSLQAGRLQDLSFYIALRPALIVDRGLN
jgi:hypothetical protein